MNRKLFINIIVMLACTAAFLLTSCNKEDEFIDASGGYTTINTTIKTSTMDVAGDPLTLGSNEYAINRVRIYAFDGNRLDNTAYQINTSSNPSESFNIELKVKQTATKKLYVIINEPTDMSHILAHINHPDAFAQIEYMMAKYFNTKLVFDWTNNFNDDKFELPMFGTSGEINTITPTPDTPISTSLTVKRCVARVDVMLQKETLIDKTDIELNSGSSISIINTADKGIIGTTTITSGALTNKTKIGGGAATPLKIPTQNGTDTKNAVRAFTFYTPEHDCSNNLRKMSFQLHDVTYNGINWTFDPIKINKGKDGKELTAFNRNMVYQIICTIKKKEIETTLNIADWDDVAIDGNIPPHFYFTVSQSKIELKNVDIASLKLASSANISFVGYQLGSSEDAIITTDGRNLPTWLPKANITGLPGTTGTATTATVSLRAVIDYSTPKYPVYLWFKAGNIKKRVEIRYAIP